MSINKVVGFDPALSQLVVRVLTDDTVLVKFFLWLSLVEVCSHVTSQILINP